MPRWKKGETEFPVAVNYNEARAYQTTIPKPVVEMLEITTKAKFVIKGKRVDLQSGGK